MDIEQHKENLKKYIEEDMAFREPLLLISDFDRYCYNHCKDIEAVLAEINKLNNVIDKLINFISLPEKLQKEVYCEYVTSNEDCCWKTDKECKDCIKEYFMKEDK